MRIVEILSNYLYLQNLHWSHQAYLKCWPTLVALSLGNSSIVGQWQTICSENAIYIFICSCNAEAKITCGQRLERSWTNLFAPSRHLVKPCFSAFFAVRESHMTEVWPWECGWKQCMLFPGLVIQLVTKSSSSCIPSAAGCDFLRSSLLEEPLDRNVPVTIERIAHLLVNPLIDCHMPVIYVMAYDMNKRCHIILSHWGLL